MSASAEIHFILRLFLHVQNETTMMAPVLHIIPFSLNGRVFLGHLNSHKIACA